MLYECNLVLFSFCSTFPVMSIYVNFHHGGSFARDWFVCYKGGKETLIEGIDDDRWSYFEIIGIVENDLKV